MYDPLNDWEYCNPDNLQDPLPQPYRTINKILQKDILNEVYNKVFEIEKHRSDPNYEGQLRTLPPQGIFDIPLISTISAQSSSSQVIAGDSLGNLMILDLSKKMRLCKKELGPKRILKVTSSTRDNAQDDFKNVCLIALIVHLDPVVYLYRYRPGENKIFQHHTITITKNTSTIAEMPVDIELSMYSQYLLVTQYNGSVLLYKIPDIKLDQTAQKPPVVVGNQKQTLKVEQAPPPIISNTSSTLETTSTELGDPIYTISFKGVKKELKYDEIIKKMKEANQQPKEPEIAAKEDPKKKAAPPQQKKVDVVAPIVEDLFEENENSKTIKSQIKDNIEQSEDYPEQKFQTKIQFITDRINIQQGNKAFNQFKQHEVVVGFAVGWTNTTRLEIHQIAKAHRNYLPGFLQQSLQILPPITNNKLETKIIEILILYPLTCFAISENSLNLGVGLKQGSVFVYDLVLLQEKFYLDKHINFVSHISFCGDMRLISASYDGGVHIYELKEGKILCKRTNQFRKGTKVNLEEQKEGLWRIISMGVSPSGIATVLDQQGECRLYDVWHGEKIAKLTAQQVMDDKLRQWNVQKSIIQCYRNEILILSDVLNQLNQNSIQIFKIFDNLVNLFPALSNVYRKGVEKEKIINLYERIPKDQLNNPAFEVPNLLGSTQQNNNLKVPGQDSKTNRLSQKKSVLMQNSQLQQSHASRQSQDQKQKNDTSSNKGSLINSLHKSNVSEQQVDFNSSFRSQNNNSTHSKTGKNTQQPNVLTKEMLHPEQFLLEKEKNSMPGLVKDESWMVEHCRSRNAEKAVRSDKVNSMISKVGQKLALEDEKQKLLERQRQLKSIK